MARLRVTRFIQDRVLNHVDASVGGVYDRYSYFDEKLAALTAWANYVDALLGKAREDVLSLHPAD